MRQFGVWRLGISKFGSTSETMRAGVAGSLAYEAPALLNLNNPDSDIPACKSLQSFNYERRDGSSQQSFSCGTSVAMKSHEAGEPTQMLKSRSRHANQSSLCLDRDTSRPA